MAMQKVVQRSGLQRVADPHRLARLFVNNLTERVSLMSPECSREKLRSTTSGGIAEFGSQCTRYPPAQLDDFDCP